MASRPKIPMVERVCLKCDRKFKAKGRFIRRCKRCRNARVWGVIGERAVRVDQPAV